MKCSIIAPSCKAFNHSAFLQSKMQAKGVSCGDCHEPHSGKLRATGSKVCLQCHLAAKYESPQHHFHPIDAKGVDCVACHAPTTTYMVVDPRHDHSFRIPRPDLSQLPDSSPGFNRKTGYSQRLQSLS